jgi:hypothetical protein
MLVKTGDAEIIGVVDPYEIEDDEKRKSALATALDKAKDKIYVQEIQADKMEN